MCSRLQWTLYRYALPVSLAANAALVLWLRIRSVGCPVKLKPDGQQPSQPLLCPHCNNGALAPFKVRITCSPAENAQIHAQSRRWFEFCFLPIIPFGSDHIWFCNICSKFPSPVRRRCLTQSRLASGQEFVHAYTSSNALPAAIPASVSATLLIAGVLDIVTFL